MIIKGNSVSPGIAIGEAYVYKAFVADIAKAYFAKEKTEEQLSHFVYALKLANIELDGVIANFKKGTMGSIGEIFVAHQEILHDEEMLGMVRTAILKENKMPDFAVAEVFEGFISQLRKCEDPLLASRTADLRDVRNRLLRVLHGKKEENLSCLQKPVIVVAHDLLPSDTATMSRECVLGIITHSGSKSSHSAILANSYAVPAIVGVHDCTERIQDGEMLGLDALSGKVIVSPTKLQCETLERKKQIFIKHLAQEEVFFDKSLRTSDGVQLQIGLNIGDVTECASRHYSDFVGLFRTEFLYMKSASAPTEEEQFIAYKYVMEKAEGKPVTLRTLDIGGDKQLPYIHTDVEANPFLGKRALRLCFSHTEIFEPQLRAALRASVYGNMNIMLPMVSSMDDIRRARTFFDKAKQDINDAGQTFNPEVQFGVMIEVPAIALIADIVAQEVDFASVGTNDLCQYLCAADRTNSDLEEYSQPFSPAMLRILSTVVSAFDKAGKSISVCGEIAGDVRGALLLAGLGYKKLSMSEAKLTSVKAAFANVSLRQAQEASLLALTKQTQAEVLAVLDSYLQK